MSYEQKPFLAAYKDSSSPSSSRQSSPSPSKKPQTSYLPTLENAYPKVITYGTIIVLTSFFWMLVVFIFIPSPTSSHTSPNQRHNITMHSTYLDCGANRSNVEARAAGCKYDVLMNAWIPAPCYDDEFIVEYLDDLSASAYADEGLTMKLHGVEEMVEANGGKFYWTSVRDHVNHCGTLWKKQFWLFFEERRELDSIIVNAGHTDHCATYLMESGDMKQSQATKVDVGFAGCWVRN